MNYYRGVTGYLKLGGQVPTVPTPAIYALVACLKITIVHNFIPVKSTKRKSVTRYIKRIKEVEYQYGHQMNLTTNVKQLGSQP